MVAWNNFDKLNSYKTLQGLKNQVELKSVMAGAGKRRQTLLGRSKYHT